MKISTIDKLAVILGGLKLNRISDKSVRNTLVNDFLHLRMRLKVAQSEAEEFRKKFREDWEEELNAVERLRAEGKPLDDHKEYLDAEKEANKMLQDLYEQEVEVALKPVKMDAFLAACGGEDMSLEQVAVLEENGMLEE